MMSALVSKQDPFTPSAEVIQCSAHLVSSFRALFTDPSHAHYLRQPTHSEIKSDGSDVTATDKFFDRWIAERCAESMSESKYVYLGEESADSCFRSDPQSHRQEYQRAFDADILVSVDGIDGTKNFSFGIPQCAVSVGFSEKRADGHVLTDGVLFLPYTGELYYQQAGVVYRENLRDGTKMQLAAQLGTYGTQMIMNLQDDVFDRYRYSGPLVPRIFGCMVSDIMYIAEGRSAGTIMDFHLWDIAGAMALAQKLGVSMWDFDSGAQKTTFNADDFVVSEERNNWRLNQSYFICTEANLEHLRAWLARK